MSIHNPITDRVIRLCKRLRRRLKAPGACPPWRVECAFAALRLLVERLPPDEVDADDLGYARNRVTSSRRYAEDGERESARYQLGELARRLARRVAS